jgi:hypothetical protein
MMTWDIKDIECDHMICVLVTHLATRAIVTVRAIPVIDHLIIGTILVAWGGALLHVSLLYG